MRGDLFPHDEENCMTEAFLGVSSEVLRSGNSRSSLSFSFFASGCLSQEASSTALKRLGSRVLIPVPRLPMRRSR